MASPKLKNSEIVTQCRTSLEARREWEKRLAYLDLVRFLEDRPKTRNSPWPNASNFAYALADMVIDDWKPQVTGALTARERLVNFAGLIEQLVPLAGRAACWFDFKIRNYTNYKREMKFAADPFMHTGQAYIKIVTDTKTGLPHFEFIDDLFIIRDKDSQLLSDDGWFVHVLQLDVDFVRRRYDGLKGLEKLIENATDPNADTDEIDEAGKIDAQYRRVGIDRTVSKVHRNKEDRLPKSNMMVLWEYHYKVTDKNGNETRRIRTVSPDDDTFDFEDDREYPDGYEGWMVIEGRREFKTKRAYDPRGLTEILAEPQAFIGAIVRTIHNKMTLSQFPMVSAPNGLPEGASQNFTLEPGCFIPFDVAFPAPPPIEAEWFQQADFMRQYGEQRGKKPDYGLREENGQDARTKYELQQIKEQQLTSASAVLDNWDDFCHQILWTAWKLIVANKDKFKDFAYVSGQGLEQMDVEALSDQYMFTVASSAEILNKQLRLDKLLTIHQMGVGKPYYREPTGFKKVIERMEPELVQELFIDPSEQPAEEAKKALLDIGLITQVGETPLVEEGQNHGARAQTALNWLSSPKNVKGLELPVIGGVIGYGKAHAKMLGKKDPKTAMALWQTLQGVENGLQGALAAVPGANGQQPQGQGQPAQGGQSEGPKISESISYKDLPAEGKIQLLRQVGIHVTLKDFMDQAQLDAASKAQEKSVDLQSEIVKKRVDHVHSLESAEQSARLQPSDNGKE